MNGFIKMKTEMKLVLVALMLAIFMCAYRLHLPSAGDMRLYTLFAYSIAEAGISIGIYMTGMKYLSLWRGTGSLELLAGLFRMILPVLSVSWVMGYEFWVIFETWTTTVPAAIALTIMWRYHAALEAYIDNRLPLTDAELSLMGGRHPKVRSDIFMIDVIYWVTVAAPVLFFRHLLPH